MKEKEKEITAQLKARLYVGGLKSLFGDMHDMIAEIEKTGQMPKDMLNNLDDVKEAIDLTVLHLKKAMMKCCSHAADEEHAIPLLQIIGPQAVVCRLVDE